VAWKVHNLNPPNQSGRQRCGWILLWSMAEYGEIDFKVARQVVQERRGSESAPPMERIRRFRRQHQRAADLVTGQNV
jgi:hypothetical protein